MADIHISAFATNKSMKDIIIRAFEKAYYICISEGVDFIIIAGDLIHTPTPDLQHVERAVNSIRKAELAGIHTYMVLGSHDYSYTKNGSLPSILAAAGLIKIVSIYSENERNELVLKPVRDDATGVNLVGVSANAGAHEVEYYPKLDRNALNSIPSPKIFVFHTAVREMRSKRFKFMDEQSVPMSNLPPGFDYYATGHIHERMVMDSPDSRAKIVFPGALIGSSVEDVASDDAPGFFIVESDESGRLQPTFRPLDGFYKEVVDFEFNGIPVFEVMPRLKDGLKEKDIKGKIVVIRLKGTVTGGPVSIVRNTAVRDMVLDMGAMAVIVQNKLTTGEPGEFQLSDYSEEVDISVKENEILSRYISEYSGTHIIRDKQAIGLARVFMDMFKGEKFSKAEDVVSLTDKMLGIEDDNILNNIMNGDISHLNLSAVSAQEDNEDTSTPMVAPSQDMEAEEVKSHNVKTSHGSLLDDYL